MTSCRKWGWLSILLLAGTVSAAHADSDCRLTLAASLDIRPDLRDAIYVTVTLDGHKELLALDTGSPTSMLTSATVDALGLSRQMGAYRAFESDESEMASGRPIEQETVVHDFEMGGMKGHNFHFAVLPDAEMPPPGAGLLGADVAQNYDIELDFAANKLNLISRDHCPGKVIYWTQKPYAAIPFHVFGGHHIAIPVKLDNVPLTALIDTGATVSVMQLSRARTAFDWRKDPAELQKIAGRDGAYTYPFGLLSLGGAGVHQPTIHLRDELHIGDADMLVGLSALRAFHIYISYDEQTIYLTAADAH